MWQPLFDGHVCSLGYEIIDWLERYVPVDG